MLKKIVMLRPIRFLLRQWYSLFYDSKYLSGYYFDQKVSGWLWAHCSMKCRRSRPKQIRFPVHPQTTISGSHQIYFQPDDLHIFQTPGCYWQVIGADITVGKGSYIAPNVGLITSNHDVNNLNKHVAGKEIVIGNSCWIGMNAVILPGVVLGDRTIVGAGAVVTKSFPGGNCIVAGNPAHIIKSLNNEEIDQKECNRKPGSLL